MLTSTTGKARIAERIVRWSRSAASASRAASTLAWPLATSSSGEDAASPSAVPVSLSSAELSARVNAS